jgi:hypothetical protein
MLTLLVDLPNVEGSKYVSSPEYPHQEPITCIGNPAYLFVSGSGGNRGRDWSIRLQVKDRGGDLCEVMAPVNGQANGTFPTIFYKLPDDRPEHVITLHAVDTIVNENNRFNILVFGDVPEKKEKQSK